MLWIFSVRSWLQSAWPLLLSSIRILSARHDARWWRTRSFSSGYSRIATRYDKRADTFIAAVFIAAIITWWLN